jgi:hypothetical protein
MVFEEYPSWRIGCPIRWGFSFSKGLRKGGFIRFQPDRPVLYVASKVSVN